MHLNSIFVVARVATNMNAFDNHVFLLISHLLPYYV